MGDMTGAFTITRRAKRFELILEIAGVPRAWSLPKEPPRELGRKRLAIELEAVPEPGEPWDAGTWTWVEGDGFSSPEESLAAGKLHFVLAGLELAGEFILARTTRGWIFFKGSRAWGASRSSSTNRREPRAGGSTSWSSTGSASWP
jgi:hypothetical protein